MWLLSRFWRTRLRVWPDLTESLDSARLPIDQPTVDAVVTLGQGSQSLAAVGAVSIDAVAALGQGSQSLAAVGAVAVDAVVILGQGSQSLTAVGDSGSPVVPPATGSEPGGGGGGSGGEKVTFEQADRLRKQLRDIETKRAKTFKDPKRFERQLQQIYETLYETPHRDELPSIETALPASTLKVHEEVPLIPSFKPLLKDLTAIRQLLDLYQTYLDDEEAVALLLLL